MLLELPEPEAGPGDLRIRVHAAAVNPTDTVRRSGDPLSRVEEMSRCSALRPRYNTSPMSRTADIEMYYSGAVAVGEWSTATRLLYSGRSTAGS